MGNGDDSDKSEVQETEYDIFRDSLLRYAGYCNEVGESFRYQFPKFVVPSYIISFSYCLADAATTGWKTYQEYPMDNNNLQQQKEGPSRNQQTLISTMDVLVWQSLASVMIPGATINMLVKASRFAVARSPIVLGALAKEWLPTVAGLGSVPFIIHPIDHGVDLLLDNTTRRWFGK